jgi:hypothetical protein
MISRAILALSRGASRGIHAGIACTFIVLFVVDLILRDSVSLPEAPLGDLDL